MSGWGSVIGGVLGMGQSFINAEKNRSSANAQRDWEKYMWELQNEYNTPKNQKQRLIDAGLNPALMYQTMPQNVSQSAGGGVQSAPANFDIAGPVMQMIQAEQMKANTDNVRADTERKWWDLRKDQENQPIQTEGIKLDNQGKKTSNDIAEIERQNREESLRLKNEGLDLNNQQTKKFLSQMSERFRNEMQKMLADIRNVNSQTNVNKGTLAVQSSQVDLNKIKVVLDEYEAKARKEGWSYGDNVLFRQIVGALGGLTNDVNKKTGKGMSENTSIYRSIVSMLMQLFD